MPELVASPSRVPVPGGKVIDEYAGRASTGDDAVSVALMTAPPGWSEPAQAPEFDEITVVLSGRLVVEHDAGALAVEAGQAVLTRAGDLPSPGHLNLTCLINLTCPLLPSSIPFTSTSLSEPLPFLLSNLI